MPEDQDAHDPAGAGTAGAGTEGADGARGDTIEDTESTEGLHRPLTTVLWLSVAILALSPYLSETSAGRVSTALLIGVTAVVALRRSGARRSVLLASEGIVAAITLITVVSREAGSAQDELATLATGLMCILLLVTPTVLVYRLGQRPRITVDTVAGALAAYIQIGLFFTALFRLVQQVQDTPFFAQTEAATPMDFQFFSFVTLTTLGYGDLVPAGSAGQSFAVMEAIIGQVFLVTVVALAVGNIGAELPRRGRDRGPDPGGNDAQAAPR